ncbi:MAG: prepilin-type N-terminal cleavage/methylation domain-containing protein [Planctomycetota bacterium]
MDKESALKIQTRRGGFTLVELLVVIAVIAILVAIAVPGMVALRKRARTVNCMSNMKQIALAVRQYEDDYKVVNTLPTWLALLCQPKYLDKPEVFVCPGDASEGAEGGRPDWIGDLASTSYNDQFPNADIDGPGGATDFKSSYLYEFNGESCEWITIASIQNDASLTADQKLAMIVAYDPDKNGVISWYEAKMAQVKGYGAAEGFGSRVPIIRCFWHMVSRSPVVLVPQDRVVNVRLDLSVDVGQPKWEDDEPK